MSSAPLPNPLPEGEGDFGVTKNVFYF